MFHGHAAHHPARISRLDYSLARVTHSHGAMPLFIQAADLATGCVDWLSHKLASRPSVSDTVLVQAELLSNR